MKTILVVNFGSSSIKFKLYDAQTVANYASGQIEVNREGGIFEVTGKDVDIKDKVSKLDHEKATAHVFAALEKHKVIENQSDIVGIGHRVVHGADLFIEPTVITEKEIAKLESISHMAPLHNPIAVQAIKILSKQMAEAINVAVFDTAFHATIPQKNYTYPVPAAWIKDLKVRKYGMHGISYTYVAQKMKEVLGENLNGVVCHLGSGSSIAVVVDGKSFDTSMGLTPLAGVMMGKRSGDIDPSIMSFVCRQTGQTPDQVEKALNNDSGVTALAGVADMRELAEKVQAGKDQGAILAATMWVDRIASFIVRYFNASEAKAKNLVFTAGIGENSAFWVERIVKAVKIADLKLDQDALGQKYADYQLISTKESEWAIYRVRTNEELVIAQSVAKALKRQQ